MGVSSATPARCGWPKAGHEVRAITADGPAATTTSVAAAIWFPYLAEPLEQALRWGARSLEVFGQLADDPSAGVVLREARRYTAGPTRICAGPACSTAIARPRGTSCPSARSRRDRLYRAGRRPPSLPAVAARPVPTPAASPRSAGGWIVSTTSPVMSSCWPPGWLSAELAGDPDVYPVRGQIVRLTNPGLTRWLLDDGDPDALTYVVPRFDDVVCGGTAEPGRTDLTPDPDVEAAILARARALEPGLADARVMGRAVGLRPAQRSSGWSPRSDTGGGSCTATATAAPGSPCRGGAPTTSSRSSGT